MPNDVKGGRWITSRSVFEQNRAKVVGRCGGCRKALCNFWVTPGGGMVAITKLSLFDGDGIEDAGRGSYRLRCTRTGCTVEPFTISTEVVAGLAMAAAAGPRPGRGRSVDLNP